MAILAIGIGIGAVLAGRLSASKIEIGLIPPGAIGLALGLSVLGLIPPSLTWTLMLMGLLDIASGLSMCRSMPSFSGELRPTVAAP